MKRFLTDSIKQKLIDKYDPDDIIMILEPSVERLLEVLEQDIFEHLDRFELDDYD